MKPSISIISVGGDDLDRANAFYRAPFGIDSERIEAAEDHVAFFVTDDFSLVLFPRDQIARSAGKDAAVAGTPGFLLTHQPTSPSEVDDILRQVVIAGGAVVTAGTESDRGY